MPRVESMHADRLLIPGITEDDDSTDRSAAPFHFSLRTALLLNTLVGIILSIPILNVGFAATFGVLAVLCALQLPLFLLFGAFSMEPSEE